MFLISSSELPFDVEAFAIEAFAVEVLSVNSLSLSLSLKTITFDKPKIRKRTLSSNLNLA